VFKVGGGVWEPGSGQACEMEDAEIEGHQECEHDWERKFIKFTTVDDSNVVLSPDGKRRSVSAWNKWLKRTETGNQHANGRLLAGDPDGSITSSYPALFGYITASMLTNYQRAQQHKGILSDNPADANYYVSYLDPIIGSLPGSNPNRHVIPLTALRILRKGYGGAAEKGIAYAHTSKGDVDDKLGELSGTIAANKLFIISLDVEDDQGNTSGHFMSGIGTVVKSYWKLSYSQCRKCGAVSVSISDLTIEKTVTYAAGIDPNDPLSVKLVPLYEQDNGKGAPRPISGAGKMGKTGDAEITRVRGLVYDKRS
jgi:hypothetical protein